jgi:hypothetical protein
MAIASAQVRRKKEEQTQFVVGGSKCPKCKSSIIPIPILPTRGLLAQEQNPSQLGRLRAL